jgi:putative alpha-1,2-mannosidase
MNPASGEYQIGSPIFEKSTITLADGKKFVIEENVSKKFLHSVNYIKWNKFDQTSVSQSKSHKVVFCILRWGLSQTRMV